ncbi:glycosyltransferase [Phenylobacterium sp.]|uniref:glycosyltransferase n=1 Tax=Phenylobacterium sp. TaxID=1871053 RepID=UPI0035B3EE61
MSRILVIGKFYAPFNGGIERNTTELCERLAAEHDVTAVVFSHEERGGEEVRNGVRVRRLPASRPLAGQPLSWSLFGAFDISEYNLVHFHAPNPLASVALLAEMARRPSPPLVITHHMDMRPRGPLRWAAQAAYGRLLAAADTILVSSHKNVTVSRDLRPGGRYVAVPFGVAARRYDVTPEQRRTASEWRRALAGRARTVGFVGRHARYKGLDVLVRALAMTPGVHAFIAGDGPYRAPAEALARTLEVQDRTHFLGEVSESDKLRLLAASDAFVLPSTEITEAFGITQLEAMAAGLPVIASDLPTGVTDVTVDGVSGLLCPPGDPLALGAAIGRLMSDEALRRRLALGARRRVEESFDEEVVLARAVDAIEAALYGYRRRVRVPRSAPRRAAGAHQVAEEA